MIAAGYLAVETVIPAQAGIQSRGLWGIPAYVGMTVGDCPTVAAGIFAPWPGQCYYYFAKLPGQASAAGQGPEVGNERPGV